MDQALYFGSHDFLSNFSGYVLEHESDRYYTAEHLYQALKIKYFRSHVRKAANPHRAKQVADKLIKRFSSIRIDGWGRDRKLELMEFVLRLKLAQHPELVTLLLATGDRVLIEDHYHPFWGRGKKGEGENQLGELWMRLRAELQSREEQANLAAE